MRLSSNNPSLLVSKINTILKGVKHEIDRNLLWKIANFSEKKPGQVSTIHSVLGAFNINSSDYVLNTSDKLNIFLYLKNKEDIDNQMLETLHKYVTSFILSITAKFNIISHDDITLDTSSCLK